MFSISVIIFLFLILIILLFLFLFPAPPALARRVCPRKQHEVRAGPEGEKSENGSAKIAFSLCRMLLTAFCVARVFRKIVHAGIVNDDPGR